MQNTLMILRFNKFIENISPEIEDTKLKVYAQDILLLTIIKAFAPIPKSSLREL
jgi:hypothetical protein